MSEIIERVDHPFWGQIQRRDGYDGWDLEIEEEWPKKGMIKIRVDFDNPDDPTVQANYRAIREKWESVWPRIVDRTEEMKASYGYQEAPINLEDDWLSLTPPKIPIAENPEWSVMLQAEEAGWLLDFKGWEDFGGQGVF